MAKLDSLRWYDSSDDDQHAIDVAKKLRNRRIKRWSMFGIAVIILLLYYSGITNEWAIALRDTPVGDFIAKHTRPAQRFANGDLSDVSRFFEGAGNAQFYLIGVVVVFGGTMLISSKRTR